MISHLMDQNSLASTDPKRVVEIVNVIDVSTNKIVYVVVNDAVGFVCGRSTSPNGRV